MNRAEHAAKRKRARIANEDRRGRRLEPEEAEACAHRRAAGHEHRQLAAHLLHPSCGALVGEAACFGEEACRNLVAMMLRLDAAGLEASEAFVELIQDVCDAATAATELADLIGTQIGEARR